MFSLLWSEHCAYKHSRKLLGRLPTEGERVVMGPGENAGAVDVGDGHAVAFKVESHNHPSAVEPFQGAATGVGGILRDVFAIGARPIAVLDSLRFGELDSGALPLPVRGRRGRDRPLRQLDRRPHGRRRGLLRGALRAQLPGQRDVRRARQDRRDDPLGRRRVRATCSSCSAPPPAATGSAAPRCSPRPSSRRATTPSARRSRSATPSRSRSCSSARLELLGAGLLVSLQDLGAAGLTSSAGEMASKGGVGHGHRRPPGAAARGRHGALRDHGLRVAGADAGGGRARQARRRCWRSARGGRRAPPRSARSPTPARCGCSTTARRSATCPSRRWWTSAPSMTSSPSEPGGVAVRERGHARRAGGAAAPGARPIPRTPRRSSSPCSPRPTSPRSAGPSSSTTPWSARAPRAVPRRPTPRC